MNERNWITPQWARDNDPWRDADRRRRRNRLLLLISMLALGICLGVILAPVAHADEWTPTDLYYANHTDSSWPVTDQARRWDKSDRITLHEIADCAEAPGPCVTIELHHNLPDMYGWAGLGPAGFTTFGNYGTALGLPGDTVWLTDLVDDRFPDVDRWHAGLVCHELGHWLTQKGNEAHTMQAGCLSNAGQPYPGKTARALIPNWKTTP